MHFYAFNVADILAGIADEMLNLDIDPKLAWALRHRKRFLVDVSRANREMLLRLPGFGVRSVDRVLHAQMYCQLRLDDLR